MSQKSSLMKTPQYVPWVLMSDMWAGFDDALNQAHHLAEKAIALDGNSAIVLTNLTVIQTWLRLYDQAISNVEKALALSPDNLEVVANCGQVFTWHGNPERGIELIERALNSETFAPAIWEIFAGISYFMLRRYDEAFTAIDRAAQRLPNFLYAHLFLACVNAELDRIDDAHNAIEAVLDIAPKYTVKEADRILAFRIDEDRNRILDTLRKAGLPES
jgi:tetratricopeptide (TPR) repeat protein